jgi:hypothetical protein
MGKPFRVIPLSRQWAGVGAGGLGSTEEVFAGLLGFIVTPKV